MKVLIIEEDAFVRAVYESELHQENIEVISASNGLEGLQLAKRDLPSLVLLELILTKLHGFEVIKEIRADKKIKAVPIIVASNLVQQVDIDQAMQFGANKYLPKDVYSSKQVIREVVNLMATLI